MAQEFVGKWDFESSDNFDEYMKAAGVGLITRKVANNLKPQIVIKVDGDHWRMESNSTFKNLVVEFDLGKEFEETTGDGRKVMVIPSPFKVESFIKFKRQQNLVKMIQHLIDTLKVESLSLIWNAMALKLNAFIPNLHKEITWLLVSFITNIFFKSFDFISV
uniref:Cytosolic fatty-acid binding proteins domain-containing protein n=1 Tax=Panagrolaimus sp. PS1159 TaxID=55785 RepID=A0AC35G072_9BILA